ncbi:hypothetical protein WA171_001225 [Blastocystis sp. BT1]
MSHRSIALFDVDGTLTEPRKDISPKMKDFILNLSSVIDIGFVGGADYAKHKVQLGEDLISQTNFLFSQNGSTAYKRNQLFHVAYLTDKYTDEQLNSFINYALRYLSDLDLPIKRGTFIQFRTSMINICPLGRDASLKERIFFEEYDKIHHIREKMIEDLKAHFKELNFTYLIGGQTSFDVVPNGFDKTYCLQFLSEYDEIHFFGDKIHPGGNDYEIYNDPRTIGHHVHGPVHTRQLCEELFLHSNR